MPSKIEEIFSVSHEVEQKLDENKGMVKMLDQKAVGMLDGMRVEYFEEYCCFFFCFCLARALFFILLFQLISIPI
jgi:hypothetical protein